MHKPLLIAFYFPFSGLTSSVQEEPQNSAQWRGNCRRCGVPRTWTEGVCCVNFGWSWLGYPPCESIWCGHCYSSSTEFKFHIRSKPVNDEDEERFENAWKLKWDDLEHMTARDGDHLLT